MNTVKHRITARAIVTLTLDIDAKSSWGEGCDLAQVHRQAGQETMVRLLDLIRREMTRGVRVVGEPKISAVITKEA